MQFCYFIDMMDKSVGDTVLNTILVKLVSWCNCGTHWSRVLWYNTQL